jgi:hypothetical protein
MKTFGIVLLAITFLFAIGFGANVASQSQAGLGDIESVITFYAINILFGMISIGLILGGIIQESKEELAKK